MTDRNTIIQAIASARGDTSENGLHHASNFLAGFDAAFTGYFGLSPADAAEQAKAATTLSPDEPQEQVQAGTAEDESAPATETSDTDMADEGVPGAETADTGEAQ